ncbi:MAG TPA: sialidase family protein [Isosphaeraceae bacterium]|nr:sialidase family protein [Isosphaeraceae bacterium]
MHRPLDDLRATSARRHVILQACIVLSLAVWLLASVGLAEEPAEIMVISTPNGGIQPQAVSDQQGAIHLLYFKGEPANGDIFYVHLDRGQEAFSAPVRVNSQPGSAIAIGTIRGALIALGREGRIHVGWNGSGPARPKNPIQGSPLLYTRSTENGSTFEPQRNLMQHTFGLDGGGSVAADAAGNVFVAWHGRETGAVDGEMGRKVWVARSQDDGKTFAPEQPALASETGACGCCGTRALADRQGNLYMLYRAAGAGVDRDMVLLTSRDHGQTFAGEPIDKWKYNQCPMSSESLIEGRAGVLAAWETKGQVHFSRLDPRTMKALTNVTPAGAAGNRKHPALAVNERGETLMAWAEGTGWQKGGALCWQLFDASNKPVGRAGRTEDGVSVWSMPTAVARPDGGFLIIH